MFVVQAYYEPNKDKPNFKVLCGARVNRIIKKTSAGSPKFKAEAVEFEWNNEVHFVKIRREVIVSAGCVIRSQISPA